MHARRTAQDMRVQASWRHQMHSNVVMPIKATTAKVNSPLPELCITNVQLHDKLVMIKP